MADAVWSSITVFVTDPGKTAAVYRALGVPVTVVDSGLVEVSAAGGPVMRLVAAEVPSRTNTGFRIADPADAMIRLDAEGVTWKADRSRVLAIRDPDGNFCYAVPPRKGHLRQPKLAMWSMFVSDVSGTARWLQNLLGSAVSTQQSWVGAVGGGMGELLREDVTFCDSDRTLPLFPAGGRKTTEAALGFQIPDLEAAARILTDGGWNVERRGSQTLVTRTPDGNPIYLTPQVPAAQPAPRRRG